MTEVRPYTILGRAYSVEDRSGHAGAGIVAAELNAGGYGLASLNLKPGAVVVDVGAHIGLVSMAVAALYPGVTVLAVEPDPANFDCLFRNLARNRVTGVEPIRMGVSGAGGPRLLVVPPDASVGTSAWLRDPNEQGAKLIEVETLPLPKLFDRFGVGRCDWLKVDVEGFEHQSLMNCDPPFFRRVGKLSVEIHAGPLLLAGGHTPYRLMRHLDECGVDYDCSHIMGGHLPLPGANVPAGTFENRGSPTPD